MKNTIVKFIIILIFFITIISLALHIYKTSKLNYYSKLSSKEMISFVTEKNDKAIISIAIIKDNIISYKIYSNNEEYKNNTLLDYEMDLLVKLL